LPGFGTPDARLLVIGLAPAAHGGNRTGRIFTGDRSGDVLFESLYRCGLAAQPASVTAGDRQRLNGVRMVAAVRCAPPENKPTVLERDTCEPWLAAELDRRDAEEAAGAGGGVNLLTYHRAKGLEWDAVFLPALEEGLLPIRQAKDDAAIAEERRLLYVGITRARRHLTLSWAHRRIGSAGTEVQRKPSRFLAMLEPARSAGAWREGAGARSSWAGGGRGGLAVMPDRRTGHLSTRSGWLVATRHDF